MLYQGILHKLQDLVALVSIILKESFFKMITNLIKIFGICKF